MSMLQPLRKRRPLLALGLALQCLAMLGCSAPAVQTAAQFDEDGVPLDWPARPEVQGPIASQWPAEEALLVGGPELGKGVQVHVVTRHDSPAVFLRWVIPGGRALEMTNKNAKLTARWPEGTMQLVAELAPMGTRALPGTAYAAHLANIGAQIDLIALPDAVIVDVHVLSNRLPQVMELLKEVLLTPELDGTLLEALKQRHKADLENDAQQPAAVADRLARRLVFGPAHPYGSQGLTLESVGKVTRKHVQEAAAAAFRLGGSHLIAVGDVETQNLATTLQKTFGAAVDMPATAVELPVPVSEATAHGCHIISLPDATQTTVLLGTEATRRADAQWPELQVTNQLLGGSASSRLFDALREKRGIGYGASSRLEGRLAGGMWMIAANVRTDATLEALHVVEDELQKLRTEAPTEAELTAAKRFLAGQFALSLADGDELADLLAVVPLYHLPPDAQPHYLQQLQDLPADRVPALASRWPALEGSAVVLAGDVSALRPGLDARCGRVVEHDVQGKPLKVFVGSDHEMTDVARSNAFALWSKAPLGLDAMTRYVTDASHLPRYRAQALTMLGASPNASKVLEMGRKAADWPTVAEALAHLMLARLGAGTPEQNAELRATVLALADGATGTNASPDLTPEAAAAAKKQLAAWALSGMEPDLPDDALKVRAHRLAEGDLARLGTGLPADVLGHWIAADVRRHEAAAALVAQSTPEATEALISGYRQFLKSGAVPDADDLRVLGGVGSLDGLMLLLNLHASLERHDAVAAQLATMQTIRQDVAAMTPQQVSASFARFDAHLEALLHMRNADDRWWAAELLITYRGLDGLRRVLSEMAVDDHYQKPEWHTLDPKVALAHLAREVIAPIGPQKLQPLLLATLVRNQTMGKVIAVTTLKALADDASIQALKTLSDETDVSGLLDLANVLTVHELALAAVDVVKYIAEVDASEKAGKLDAASAEKHRAAAFGTYDLLDKRLRAEVNRVVSGAPAPAPDVMPEPEQSSQPSPGAP
jgi:zinc protease